MACEKVYAFYRGDELVDIGTITELSERTGLERTTLGELRWTKRGRPRTSRLIKFEEGEKMVVNLFYDRIEQEKGDMSLQKFLSEFQDVSRGCASNINSCHSRGVLPSIPTMITLDVLFTLEEMEQLLMAKIDSPRRPSVEHIRLADDYLCRMYGGRKNRPKSRSRQVSRKHWLMKAVALELEGENHAEGP